jgi:hypothetical protein
VLGVHYFPLKSAKIGTLRQGLAKFANIEFNKKKSGSAVLELRNEGWTN